MAMYANTLWSKVSNMASRPQWAVFVAVWDQAGNVVFDQNGQPVIGPIQVSPPGAPAAEVDHSPPIPVVSP